MTIIPTALEDLDKIVIIFQEGIEYQKSKSDDYWQKVDRALLEKEIGQQLHWKIMKGEEIACFFSVVFADPLIWDERDADPSIYLHRIVTNQAFRGRGYVRHIVHWAQAYGRANGKQFIRLDTHRNNQRLNACYADCGFDFCGVKKIDSDGAHPLIPAHYLGEGLSLYEKKI